MSNKRKKSSFFEKLTGTVVIEDDATTQESVGAPMDDSASESWETDEIEEEGQLPVDVYETPSHVILQTMVAGVRPDDLDISITRELISIKGRREGPRSVNEEDWVNRELYWGTFARTIHLPAEVEAEESEAIENHGLLIIKMPKIDKERQMKLKVKSSGK